MISLGRQDSPTEDGLVLATGSLDLADFVSATSDGNRELQDLSLNDAEELQAFVAKRKWFEIKLQLEGHVPIYPFVNLDLKPSQGLMAVGVPAEAGAPHTLPNIESVIRWQEERNAIEGEVVAFDGGDLDRMKQKTRAATLLPLTPPSTELVEVTLDLIVVVDRLLTLLRRRSELLELTKYRLYWDEMRMSCAEELGGMRLEADLIAARKCEWLPIGMGPRSKQRVVDVPQDCPTSPPNNARAQDAAPITPRPQILGVPNTPSPSKLAPRSTLQTASPAALRSPSPSATPRRASLRIPLMRSQVANLRIRHTTLSATVLPRVGALLDRMIDVAGPLRNLGGTHGPTKEGADADGAVPGELLDAQDDLERQAASIGERIQWCQELETQCTSAEQLHASLLRVGQTAWDIVTRLEDLGTVEDWAIGDDENTESARELIVQTLQDKWASAFAGLPLLIDHTQFTSSFTDPYPQNGEHEIQVITVLEEALESARTVLQRGKQALDWLTRLSDQRIVVQRCCSELVSRERRVAFLLDRISTCDLPSELPVSPMYHDLVADLEEWCCTTQSDKDRALFQRSTAASMKFRAIIKAPPPSFTAAATICEHDPTLARLDDLHVSTESKTAELIKARDQFLHDRQIGLLATKLHDASFSIRSGLSSINADLLQNIGSASWKGYRQTESVSIEGVNVRLSKLQQSITVDLITPHRDLKALIGHEARHHETLSTSTENISIAQVAYQTAVHNHALLERVSYQTKAVDTIHDEADALLSRLEGVQCSAEVPEDLQHALTTWLDRIAARVPFLSATFCGSSGLPILNSTEIASSPPVHHEDNDATVAILASTDRTIRDALNKVTAKVSGAWKRASSHTTESESDASKHGPGYTSLNDNLNAEPAIPSASARIPVMGSSESDSFNSSSEGLTRSSVKPSLPNSQFLSSAPSTSVPAAGKSPDRSGMRTSNQTGQRGPPLSTDTIPSGNVPPLAPSSATTISSRTKRSSLGSAAGNLYSSRRAPSIPDIFSQGLISSKPNGLDLSRTQREDRILARSTSTRSSSLAHSIEPIPSARRVISASRTSSSKSRRISSRNANPFIKPPARKYVPNPENKLDVAVGDIVNGLKVHVPIFPIGMTAKDEYKDMTGSYWIGAEGRAKLCFCRILRSQTVMVRVGGGWVELSKFLKDHFGGSTLENSLSSLTLNEQSAASPANVATPTRSRVESSSSASAETPNRVVDPSPKNIETSGSPLTPLKFIKRASDSPDMRQKEKASLRIGRRSILGKE